MSTQEQIRSFAARIERPDEEIKSLNSDKKEVYSEMKAHGFDVKAFKVAHRKFVAQSSDPAGTQEADALADIYLLALQGAEGAETQSGANLAQLRAYSESPSRVRAHEAPVEPQPVPVLRPQAVQEADAGSSNVASASQHPDDVPDIPDFLNRSKRDAALMAAG